MLSEIAREQPTVQIVAASGTEPDIDVEGLAGIEIRGYCKRGLAENRGRQHGCAEEQPWRKLCVHSCFPVDWMT